MKPWQYLLLGVFFGIAASAVILIVSSTPRGKPILLVPPGTPRPITVHISGSVANSGVFSLPSGSRVIDIVHLAGGMTQDAAVSLVNLAAPLQDGQKITIPSAQVKTLIPNEDIPGSANFETNERSGDKININTAIVGELETLPGIGNSKALAIIEYRKKFGPFRTILDIQNVPGIGTAIYEKVKEFICTE